MGPEFNEQYVGFIDARLAEKHKPKDQRDNVLIEGYKLILNGTKIFKIIYWFILILNKLYVYLC